MRIYKGIALSVLFLLAFSAKGQQFDWVKGGGTGQSDQGLQITPEGTYFMCTDPNGNVYALSNVGDLPIYADTFYRPQGAYGSDNNILITSYTCTGQMRWAKLVGGPNLSIPTGILVDSVGHLYVAGNLNFIGGNHTLHIGTDISISTGDYRRAAVMQLDTNGNFNWIKFTGDTSLLGNVSAGTLALDGSDNVHFFNYAKSGDTLMPNIISSYGTYELIYNPTGTLQSATRLNIDSSWVIAAAAIDPASNKVYVTGYRNFGLSYPTYPEFAAAFDVNRSPIWFDTLGTNSALNSVIFDRMGHLYFNGSAQPDVSLSPTVFSFNGDSISNGAAGDITVIVKTDTNGHIIWIQSFDCTSSINTYFYNTLTLLPNNLIASLGTFGGQLTNANGPDSIVSTLFPAGEGQNPFLTLLDTSGVVMSLRQIHGDGLYDWGLSIASDKVGNIYVGGQVEDSIFAGSVPAYHTVGGNTDFFVMKYGVDCDCTSMPIANYSDTGTLTRGFTYTGTTASVDSIVWRFGDGSPTINSMGNQLHTYDTGTFEACVFAYTPCGMDMHCSRIRNTPPQGVGIVSLANFNVEVYPNPATDGLNIKTETEGVNYRLLNITGAFIQGGLLQKGSNNISLQSYTPGVYLLEIISADGASKISRIVKE